jgi:hypothetical protein
LASTATLLLLIPVATGATQVRYRSVEQLGQQSTTVVRGTVAAVHSYWNAKHTKVFTRTTIAVDETYKGAGTPQVQVLQLGGVVDDVRVTVCGAPAWTDGEEVLLFLEPYVDGAYQVSGFSQGKFAVETDPATGRKSVLRPAIEDAQIVGGPAGSAAAADAMESVPLDRFLDRALQRR